MDRSDFYYELPQELIAQTPLTPRDSSRLLKISRDSGELTHSHFFSLCDFLEKGDLLVLNDSKVFPARLFGKKRGSLIDVEFLLQKQIGKYIWETMVRPGRRLKKDTIVDFSDKLAAQVLETLDGGNRLVRFYSSENNFDELLFEHGQMPLPPYITEELSDNTRYNTIYSKQTGSAAAPTAGLHFTERLLADIAEKGVETAFVTLHVGLGTFRPVKHDNIQDHHMHEEFYSIPEETAKKIAACRLNGKRVIAVGTTSCRTLEAAAVKVKEPKATSGSTDIFIYPGYKFKATDGIITNFHLPESTLLMLVCAFLGYDKTLAAYAAAIKEKYRFFSFGDAMLII
ncbi:MAG: tRNA preQ1(34) S-adenosylmethionine ribosyltransferase-isomerase QueA [Oscillospiraceae bacterium]|nr:tRNA preQ1(34) S-adenosylmethionine ribosyltransferase-isomerase QueA [Oscillospiraceae bacterium]